MKNTINYKIIFEDKKAQVASLFTSVFSLSEGEKEGELVGKLAWELCSDADNKDIICMGAYAGDELIGAIFFSRLRFDGPINVYMLAPVAVSSRYQGKGIGQALINDGLNEMRNRSVDVVVTYGDPAFYTRVGFQALSQQVIKAPLTLSMPEGWLGQSLTGEPIPTIDDSPVSVKAFDDPVYW